ncbi:MAG: hypothetical protein QNJ22_10550 [Desulfosarcinaceae bacterium]|nr:hypothetical protein [Desulfosarcinaceae bacterium]
MNYLAAVAVFVCQETIAILLFPLLARWLGPSGSRAWDPTAILKGIVERLVLFTALIHNYPQMLIAFGAMKLGTRLHDDKDAEISNTYFLIGNLLSILLAMIGAIVTLANWG